MCVRLCVGCRGGGAMQTLAILAYLHRQRLACRCANASILQVVARAAKRAGESGGAKKKATAAMSIRWTVDQAAWTLLHEGSTFAEAGITRLVRNTFHSTPHSTPHEGRGGPVLCCPPPLPASPAPSVFTPPPLPAPPSAFCRGLATCALRALTCDLTVW